MLPLMDGISGFLIRLGVRVVVFGAAFLLASRKTPRVAIRAWWAIPLVASVFALLNTALYWALKPLLDLATFGMLALIMPLVVNTLLLVATVRLFGWRRVPRVVGKASAEPASPPQRRPLFEIDGIFTTVVLAAILTVLHGALWVAFDYLPNR